MKWPTPPALCALLALPTLTFAQQGAVQQREVKGKPDTDINAGIFATIRKDCTAGPLPAVRLVTPPAQRQGDSQAGQTARHQRQELPWDGIARFRRDLPVGA